MTVTDASRKFGIRGKVMEALKRNNYDVQKVVEELHLPESTVRSVKESVQGRYPYNEKN